MLTQQALKDHLFISYATEDWILADWLVLKLASEGYKVWYDRLKLLGGESYPRDITDAIVNRSFRVIALLSRHSILKPNPVKERTLALSVGKERRIDFLIPINVDGLRPTELDFLTSDLVYIPFDRSWYQGLSSLLKKLQQVDAPKDAYSGRAAISTLLSADERPTERPEVLWSNWIPVLQVPSVIHRYKVVPEVDISSAAPDWSTYWESESEIWAFDPPPGSSDWVAEAAQFDFREKHAIENIPMKNVVSGLLRRRLEVFCLNKGLSLDERSGRLYFPNGLLPNNKLSFTRYDGRRINIRAVSERKFRVISQGKIVDETSRYHLSPDFRFFFDLLGEPTFRLRLSVYWTDLQGNPLDPIVANRRRKSLCKDWWNYEWLSRTLAVMQWISDGKDEATLLKTSSGDFMIGLEPVSFSSNLGIDEASFSNEEKDEDDLVVLDDVADGEDDGATTTSS